MPSKAKPTDKIKTGNTKSVTERGRTNPNDVKKGFLSKPEVETVKELMGDWSAEAIAKKLRRSPKQIRDEIEKLTGITTEQSMTLAEQLETRPEWRTFTKQFSADELDEFKHQYVQIMSQMKDHSVWATEELQVFQVITLKIQIDRLLGQQKRALDTIDLAEKELEYLRQEGESADPLQIDRYEQLKSSAEKTNRDCVDAYKVYSDKQDKMLNALKATRDQRVKNLENSKGSIFGWLRSAMEEDQRRALGEEAEMMRIASKKEKARLATPHKFADGVLDQPIFTPETVLLEFDKEAATFGREEETAESED